MNHPPPDILHRDPDFLAIDKPAGLASVRERWTDDESALVVVWDLLRKEDPEARKPRVVHRLDKQTSGVILFATSLPAARALSRQFREREVEKTYVALVAGVPPDESGTIELRLDTDPSRPGHSVVVKKRGKEAITHWRTREVYAGYSLLELRPRTGRTHQIRVSLRAIGYPILGDHNYGGRAVLLLSELKPGYKRKKGQRERPLLGRVGLHAERTAIHHPITGERVDIEAPLPKDLRLCLKYLA